MRFVLVVLLSFVLVLSQVLNASSLTLSLADKENIDCLREVYPDIVGVDEDQEGIWLIFSNKNRVLYGKKHTQPKSSSFSVDVRTSMNEPYFLEPIRPETPKGYAPGRKRSFALLRALYGNSKAAVQASLKTVKALEQNWLFHKRVAKNFLLATRTLEAAVRTNAELKGWLVSNGTFVWRKIAGENIMSAHSFGIAFDIGVKRGATYWRWSKLNPHPLQKNYPSQIVAAFEKAGFIWGGKWHEYDLMHFEYRPELICKAKKKKAKKSSLKKPSPIAPNKKVSVPSN